MGDYDPAIVTGFKYVGGRYPASDAVRKAGDDLAFGSDMRFSGMVHATLLLSPHAHARILRIDSARARGGARDRRRVRSAPRRAVGRGIPSRKSRPYKRLAIRGLAADLWGLIGAGASSATPLGS